jgi:uncharacterized protein with von Willebrand factor type A (vWA) domain
MKLKIQLFSTDRTAKPRTFKRLSLDQARKVARTAAALINDARISSFTITCEDGSVERWFNLEGEWRQLH